MTADIHLFAELLRRNGALVFFEQTRAPRAGDGFRLPLALASERLLAAPRVLLAVAKQLAAVEKGIGVNAALTTQPVMRPLVTLAAEKANLPFVEWDDLSRALVGGAKKGRSLTLVYDVIRGGEGVRDDVEMLGKAGVRVSSVVALVDFLKKGDEDEIVRRQWFLKEGMSLHALLVIDEWLMHLAENKKISLELAEHCIAYLRNPRALDADPLWWMKYHELLARNRIIWCP